MWIPETIEVLVVAALLAASYAMLRNRFAANLIVAGFRAASFVGSCLLAIAIFRIAVASFGNVIWCLLFSLLLSSTVSGLALLFLRRWAQKKNWRESLHQSMHLPVWCDRLLSTVMVSALWVGCFVFAWFAGEFLLISPWGRAALQRNSLY